MSYSLVPSNGSEVEDVELGKVDSRVNVPPEEGKDYVTIIRVGRPNTRVAVDLGWTGLQFKQHIFEEEWRERKNIRVIYQGKLLEDTSSLTSIGVASNSFLHVVVSDFQPEQQRNENEAQPNPLGLPEGELALLPYYLEHQAAEQQHYEGTSNDFFCGLVLGFVLGPIMLLWLFQQLPRRQKVGIVMGLLFNAVYNFFRFLVTDRSRTSTTSAPTLSPAAGLG
eukprot:TRINITY_DN4355_c0_g5_i3.p1 TRINITY_DN4355_c0_g5~~TRINITY_DN4355_c0_g5_i3.p1  ORF type:complete len:223 (+),score=42.03 TRINITY_DN4355_c0_g5_i3:88-756(+)